MSQDLSLESRGGSGQIDGSHVGLNSNKGVELHPEAWFKGFEDI